MQFLKSLPLISALAIAVSAHAMAADIPLGGMVDADEIVTKVISVDAKDHRIVVEDGAGHPATLQLTDAADDLNHLNAGDYVAALVVHSAVFDLDTTVQTQAPGGFSEEGAVTATPTNPHPGGDAFRMARVQMKIVGINHKKHELTFEGPDGTTKVVSVDDAKLRSKMRDLKVGEMVNVTYEDTLQIVSAHPKAPSVAKASK
ncbi:hypothetical protein JVX91_28500 [Pseudomonas sp. PDNC002]|uniref:hypothetical protein n=1 Tax=Pseudomonas sp. PDNC002 TaxID=2811422 RepID=UPI001963FA87|nr:hypothetical protein [Pseudomonas sp. PDNC002]QRY79458.1 hypothetical protein JVX91_28500 [Pseudomonas sp. PDNC002]